MAKLFDLDVIDPNPYQIRDAQENTHVRQIAESIAEHGLMQTPIGRKAAGRVQLAFGNTRYEAFRLLVAEGKPDYAFMPVEIQDLTDEQMFELGVSENVDRKDLNPIEKSRGMRIYRDKFGKTSEQIGKRFGGLSDSAVRNIMRYLDLPETLQHGLANGQVLEGTARAMLRLNDLSETERQRAEDQDTYPKPSELVELALIGESQKRMIELINSLMNWLRPAPKPIPGMLQELPLESPAPEPQAIPAPAPVEPEVEEHLDDEAIQQAMDALDKAEAKPVEEVKKPSEGPSKNPETFRREEEELPDDGEAEEEEHPQQGDQDYPRETPKLEERKTNPPAIAEKKPVEAAVKTQTPAPAPTPAAAPATPAGAKGSWACATIALSLTMWPDDGDEKGRMVMIGARVNQESPRMVMARQAEIILPVQLAEMLAKLREDYGGEA
jgi:ParB/RepB/Spo0J family partition protein